MDINVCTYLMQTPKWKKTLFNLMNQLFKSLQNKNVKAIANISGILTFSITLKRVRLKRSLGYSQTLQNVHFLLLFFFH